MAEYLGRMTTADRIAERIEVIRDDRQVSVRELSDVTGIADKTLRRRRINPAQLSFGEFDALCGALDVRPEQVLDLTVPIEALLKRVPA